MTALTDAEREELARQHLCCNLSDAERDALNECECGHFRNEHSSDGCLATEDEPDRSLHGVCICSHSPEAVIHHAVQEIRDAAREQVLAQVEALHRPWSVCDDCDHEHTDAEVREGKAFDTGYSYTCLDAVMYVACAECCVHDGEQTEDCACSHEHTLSPDDRCPTAALVASLREGAER